MDVPALIKIGKKKYYLADELLTFAKIFCKGSKNGRQLVEKKQIPDKYYVYARKDDDEWIVSDGKSRKVDKVLISKKYAKKYIPEFSDVAKYEIEMAPPILVLRNKEKFKDHNDNIIDIEVRGERDVNNCFFKVKDIAEGFNIKYLYDVVIDKSRNGYEPDIHYKYFNVDDSGNARKNAIKKTLFLTFQGLLRAMFVSKSKSAEDLALWATKTLFTVQLGTKVARQELASNLLDVSPAMIKNVFKKSTSTLPCIYLIELGSLNDSVLRKSFKVDEDDYLEKKIKVGKFGLTDDLVRRTGEHKNTYGSMNGVNMKLIMFQFIDPLYLSEAETSLKSFMRILDIKFEYKNHKELIAYTKSELESIQKQFRMIGNNYKGQITELININKELEHKYQIKLAEERHKNELLQKDIEILKIKHQYSNQ
jgi:hypothetical protein